MYVEKRGSLEEAARYAGLDQVSAYEIDSQTTGLATKGEPFKNLLPEVFDGLQWNRNSSQSGSYWHATVNLDLINTIDLIKDAIKQQEAKTKNRRRKDD
jgi:hypothetical protein